MHFVAEGIQADEFDIIAASRRDQMTQTGSVYQRRSQAGSPGLLIATPRSDFPLALQAVNSSILSEVCQSLKLDESNPIESLVSFASELSPKSYFRLLRLLSPVDLSEAVPIIPPP
jgi:hypothetical protein